MKLYQFADEFAKVADMISEDGEIGPDMQARLESLEMDLGKKVDNICRLIRMLEGQAVTRKIEIDRMGLLNHQDQTRVEALKKFLVYHLSKLDRPAVTTDCFKVRVQDSQPSVDFVGDPRDLPAGFVKSILEPSKRAALEAHKAGQPLPDGFTVRQGKHVRIS